MRARRITVVGLSLVIVLLAAATVRAADLTVHDGWVRWLPGDLPLAGYLQLQNSGAAKVLVGATSPDFASVMLHQSIEHNGMSHMDMVPSLAIPAGSSVTLAPGGYHFMLVQARHPIRPGDVIRIELQFDDGSAQSIRLPVRSAAGEDSGSG